MARSWLTTSLLPSNFWFHAVKRAVEVSNYLPVTLKGQTTTPFEFVYHHKPDIRVQISLIGIAYIDHLHPGNTNTTSYSTQTLLQVILTGRSDKTNALEFYRPPTKQIYTSAEYRLDTNLAAGPIFNLHFDGCDLFFNTYHI